MVKTKTPFMSLSSSGTVGGVLTTQKRGRDTILRSTPIPTDPLSLSQRYQRWDYRDYAYLWTLETEASKQSYRTRASRYHITGFNLWMRENLKALTGLLARWHLDDRNSVSIVDTSKKENHGTVFGASPEPGLIDFSYFFDGLNDYIATLSVGFPTGSDARTILCWAKPTSQFAYDTYLTYGKAVAFQGFLFTSGTDPKRLYCGRYGGNADVWSNTDVPLDEWSLVGVDLSGSNVRYWFNGELDGTATLVGADTHLDKCHIGKWYFANNGYFHGFIDEMRVFNRLLDGTEWLRHYNRGRRYPA